MKTSFVLAGMLAVSAPSLALADDGDFASWAASQALSYDSNLFRLPAGASPQGTPRNRADTQSRTSLRVDLDQEFGLQRVRASGKGSAVRFDRNSSLDYNDYNAEGAWNWALGSLAFGTAAARKGRTLASLADVRSSARNIVDSQYGRFDGGTRIAPEWSIVAGVDQQRREVSGELSTSNYTERGRDVALRWDPLSGLDSSLQLRHSAVVFPNAQPTLLALPPAPVLVSPDYSIDQISLRAGFEPNGVSRFGAQIGITERRTSSPLNRDFKGLNYSIDYDWRFSGVLDASAYARRSTSALSVLVPGSTVDTSFGVRPVWRLTGKVTVTGQVDTVQRKYSGDTTAALLGQPERRDRIWTSGLSVSWDVMRHFVVSGEFRFERRWSNIPNIGFSANVTTVNAEYRF